MAASWAVSCEAAPLGVPVDVRALRAFFFGVVTTSGAMDHERFISLKLSVVEARTISAKRGRGVRGGNRTVHVSCQIPDICCSH